MILLNDYLRARFGCKVYKIALNGGFTCPNRDGKLDTRGCIFCSAGGSGDFAGNPEQSITEQIEVGKKLVAAKNKDGKYIAYFQAFTGTYLPQDTAANGSKAVDAGSVHAKSIVERLEAIYREAMEHPDVVALSIATRPDCLPAEILDLLERLNREKPVWVELGLQTIHERTATYIRRGYPLSVYDRAVRELSARNIEFVTHVILGLPGESEEDMLATVDHVCRAGEKSAPMSHASPERAHESAPMMRGIKLQLLHVLRGTDLEKEYLAGKFHVLTEDEYIRILKACVSRLPADMVVHRLTGDGDKKILVAPLWSADKKHVWNRIQREVLVQ